MMRLNLVFLFASTLFLLVRPGAADEYSFVSPEGEQIEYPSGVIPFSPANPGPWKGFEPMHQINLDSRIRKQGLEQIRILRIRMNHPMGTKEAGTIQRIYVADKDNLMIGFEEFPENSKEVDVEIWINGVINYIQVIVECSKHGFWRRDFDLKA